MQGGLSGLFGGEQQTSGGVFAAILTPVGGPRHGVHVRLRGRKRGVHIGQFGLDQLKLADGLAELLPLVDVGHHHVQTRLHDAQGTAGQHQALKVQSAHQHPDSVALFAKHVLLRHFAVLEDQL